jgi:hypothetical protein
LTTISPSSGLKRTAASCCATDQQYGQACGLLRLGASQLLESLAEFMNVRRGIRESIKLAFLAISKLDFFFCAASEK